MKHRVRDNVRKKKKAKFSLQLRLVFTSIEAIRGYPKNFPITETLKERSERKLTSNFPPAPTRNR